MLTVEYVCSLFEYIDGDLYWRVNRGPSKAGDKAGSKNNTGYLHVSIDSKLYKNHRIIWLMHNGSSPKFVDHIDGDPLNNKIENLRGATQSQNMMNLKTPRTNTSGIKGVSWYKPRRKWRVSVTVNGKQKSFGCFDDIELAELVAIEARNKYHGEFARHN